MLAETPKNVSEAAALQEPFNPWVVPDTFTVYTFAPDYVRPFLHPHWQTQKAVHPYWSYFFGLYYLVMGTVAIAGNSMVLKIFSNFKSLRTPANMLVINLAVSDLCLMISLIPEAVYNFLSGGPWQFGEIGCQIHSFCGALFGYSQITTLTLISYDRYNVICNGLSGKSNPLTHARAALWILLNWIWAFAWSVSPLVGWGLYALDGMLGTCSFDSYTTTWNHKSHILASCLFQWALPILVIIFCYVFIIQAVFKHEEDLRAQARKMNVSSLRTTSNPEQQNTSAEIKAAKIAVIAVAMWTISWTPFTLVSMLGTWHDSSFVTPLMSEVPIICAKTSAVFNPIIYALSHPKYRECLKEMYPWLCIVVETKSSRGRGEDTRSNATTSATTYTSD